MNISLLCKWWWKLETEKGLWQELVEKKYLRGNPISVINQRHDNSPIWTDLLKIREIYLRGRIIQTADGKRTLFWKDVWLYNKPLCLLHPMLFDWCQNKNITVHNVLERNGRIPFNRWLPHHSLKSGWRLSRTHSLLISVTNQIR